MEEKYKMGFDDGLHRNKIYGREKTRINSTLRKKLIRKGIEKACDFYEQFFNENNCQTEVDVLTNEYQKEFNQAQSLGLFEKGGIREKYHLSLWCLGRVLAPDIYIESGVFIGSSLHAFLRIPGLQRIIAIDPDMGPLKIPKQQLKRVECVDQLDFSQLKLGDITNRSLVFFDDHFNTARRIIQAKEQGIKFLLFDDSTGIEGVCQRLYPAIPTITMIMNYEMFREGDYIEWVYEKPYKSYLSLKNIVKKYMGLPIVRNTKVRFQVDETFIKECRTAKELIDKYARIPGLGEYIHQTNPERLPDDSKYLIELKG